MYTFKMRKY